MSLFSESDFECRCFKFVEDDKLADADNVPLLNFMFDVFSSVFLCVNGVSEDHEGA